MAQKPKVMPIQNVSQSTSLVTTKPAFLDKYKDDAGRGYSHKAEDRTIPFVSIMDIKSPQLNPRNEAYIQGAEAGDIYLKGAVHPIVKSEVGLLVQPCAYDQAWVEWVPRSKGGGFVARYPMNAKPEIVEKPDPENENRTKTYTKSSQGVNELIHTRYHYVLTGTKPWTPYVIGFKSTGHTVSRDWTTLITNLSDGGIVPSFGRLYRLLPKLHTKNQNEWYLFSVDVLRDELRNPTYIEDEAQYLAGQSFCSSIESGLMTAADDESEEDTSSATAAF
jgi:hypothetical protein